VRKDEAIRIITSCAKQFSLNLENKNLLFLFEDKGGISFIETLFLPRHYLHLTGIKLSKKNIGSSDFYRLCLKGKLSPFNIQLSEDGTTEMKLSILSKVINIHKTAKMIGDYNFEKSLLMTEKIVGNVTACVGFVRDNNYYVPNTALREDIREITVHPIKKILAVFTKGNKDTLYSEVSYLAKDVSLDSIELPDELHNKVCYQESKQIEQSS